MKYNLLSDNYKDIEIDTEDELNETGLEFPGQIDFSIDIEETLTSNKELVKNFAKYLDNIENVKKILIQQLHEIYKTDSEHKESIDFLIEYVREDVEIEYQTKIFKKEKDEILNLSDDDFIDLLQLKRIGLCDQEEYVEYIIDFSFNPQYIDELLVVYTDEDMKITRITNES